MLHAIPEEETKNKPNVMIGSPSPSANTGYKWKMYSSEPKKSPLNATLKQPIGYRLAKRI